MGIARWVVNLCIKDAVHRMALIDRFCGELGRDPASITRSTIVRVSYDQPGQAVAAIGQMTGLGFGHIVLSLPTPYPAGVARWVADKIIAPSD